MDIDGFKQGQRLMWSTGDYPDIAKMIQEAADAVVESSGVQPDELVLDVATGSGNVAVVAAGAGARVTGLDLTPELLDVARARASEAGLSIEWVEGDAEKLPYADDTFDRVTSCFGVMFAPRHEVAARELARVARPGATVSFAAWTPEGITGRMFRTVASHMPPPPPELIPAVMWGNEDHVRSLFADTGAELAFERRAVMFVHDSPDSWVEYQSRTLGPAILARGALEPQGRWEDLRQDLVDLYSDGNEAEDGTLRAPGEYLISVATMPA